MANIKTKLILDNKQFNRGIDDSAKRTNNFSNNLSKIRTVAKAAATALGALTVATVGLAKRQAELGARLQDTADKLGLNVGFLQEFRYAAEQSGVATTTADMALQRFTRRVAEAANGTGAAREALVQLGIQLRDSNGNLRSTDKLIYEVADALQNVESESERVRLAFKLFDSEGVSLLNTLQKGSGELQQFADRARELGAVLDAQDTQALKDLDSSFTDLSVAIKGVVDQFVVGLADALELTNNEITNLIANNQTLARELGRGVGEAFRTIAAALKVVSANIDVVRNALLTLVGIKVFQNLAVAIQSVVGLLTSPKGLIIAVRSAAIAFGVFAAKIAAVVGVVYAITQYLRSWKDETIQLGDTTTTVGETVKAIFWGISQVVKSVIESISDWFSQLRERMTQPFIDYQEIVGRIFVRVLEFARLFVNRVIGLHVAMIKSIGTIIFRLPDLFMGVFSTIIDIVKASGTTIANILRAAVSLDFEGVQEAYRQFGQQAAQAIRDGAVQEFTGLGSDIKDIFSDAFGTDYVGMGTDFLVRGVKATKDALGELVLSYRKAQEEARKLGRANDFIGPPAPPPTVGDEDSGSVDNQTSEFLIGWDNAFTQWRAQVTDNVQYGQQMFQKFTQGLSSTLTDFFTTGKMNFRGFLSDIMRMIIQSQINRAIAGIFGAMGAGSGAGIFASLFGGAFADGGRPPPGKASLVGERGPELFVPKTSGTIIPNEMLGNKNEQIVNNYITNNISALDSKSVAQVFAENRQTLLGTVQTAQRELP